MRKVRNGSKAPGDLDLLIDEIITDAHGDDEQLWAFRQAFQHNVSVPCDAFVIGEPVSVASFDYDGNPRRGLTASCRRAGFPVLVACCRAPGERHRLLVEPPCSLTPFTGASRRRTVD